MPDTDNKLYEAIDALGKDKGIKTSGKTKKVTVTLPLELVNAVNHYKEALGYPTFSASLKAILEAYFNSLIKE